MKTKLKRTLVILMLGISLFICLLCSQILAYNSVNDFEYTVVNNSCILVNNLNTKILSGSGVSKLNFNYSCDSSLNTSINQLNNLYNNFSNTTVKCNIDTSKLTSTLSNDFMLQLDDMAMMLDDAKDECVGCGECGSKLTNCERTRIECNNTQEIFDAQVSFIQSNLNKCEKDSNQKTWLIIIICLLMVLLAFMAVKGFDLSNFKLRGG